ncbi:redoxin domain-containing protein [Massilia sp. NEAU-DD11]|uniref:Redoxin domain-containing protein n=2 Tax=Massilia TaxID=149698 RepID=A0A7X3K8F1_9BURK|nr:MULTISPECIES: redoxin domain-containing protein [Telluria group]MDN4041531.1 redoxin domain-containing protein [Massilia sp. YIM B02787]MVW61878.1 redoxin domain-containing protein [Telluria cellulosilytica]
MLWLVLLVCASPMIASYFTYYVIKPEKRNNYGTLIDQRAHPVPAMATTTLDGRPQALEQFKGKWVMLMVGPGACPDSCRKQLFALRQLRLMQGKEADRIERVWLITDREPLDTLIIREYDGTHMLRADGATVASWLPADTGTTPADHIYLIDPLGHLMMRFPKDPQLQEVRKVYKDINKLLKASAVG